MLLLINKLLNTALTQVKGTIKGTSTAGITEYYLRTAYHACQYVPQTDNIQNGIYYVECILQPCSYISSFQSSL